MSPRHLFMAAAITAAIALFGASASAQSVLSFTSAAVGNSGVTGSGTISALGAGDESTLNAQWQGLVPGSVHMVSQYHGAGCSSYDAAPEFVFSAVTADSQGKASASITVKKPFRNWPNRPHFEILHATADSASAAIACGTVIATAVPTTVATAAATAVVTAVPATATAQPLPPRAGSGTAPDGSSMMPLLGAGAVLLIVGASTAFVLRRRA